MCANRQMASRTKRMQRIIRLSTKEIQRTFHRRLSVYFLKMRSIWIRKEKGEHEDPKFNLL